MSERPFTRPRSLLAILVLLLLVVPGSWAAVAGSISFDTVPGDDIVLQWNEMTLDLIRASQTGGQMSSRTMAMVHASMYDAINGITGEYLPYRYTTPPPAGASREAAGAAAAHRILLAAYPGFPAEINGLYESQLAAIPEGQPKTDGIAYGEAVAGAMMAWRSMDGSMAMVPYTQGSEPGDWQPTPPGYQPPMMPQWRYVTPWLMTSPAQFRQNGPPALGSAEYATSYNLTKQIGGKISTVRTADQTDIGRFWADGMGNNTQIWHYNSIAQGISRDRGLAVGENARLFALLDMTLADGLISAWDMKYGFDRWRPVTAIRLNNMGSSPFTEGDPAWDSLIMTPVFQEYISTHSLVSAGGAELLARFFGTDTIPVTRTSELFPNLAPRSYPSLSAMADEVARSRVYSGVHFDFSNRDGALAGRSLAGYAFANFLNRKGMTGPDVEPVALTTLPLRNCKILSGAPAPSTVVTFVAQKNFFYGSTTTIALPGGGSIHITASRNGRILTFTSDRLIYSAMVKGGPAANLYNYVPYEGTVEDDSLVAPRNRAGLQPAIGYVQFCHATA